MWCVVVVCGNKMWCGQCGAVRVRVLVVAGSETGGECGRLWSISPGSRSPPVVRGTSIHQHTHSTTTTTTTTIFNMQYYKRTLICSEANRNYSPEQPSYTSRFYCAIRGNIHGKTKSKRQTIKKKGFLFSLQVENMDIWCFDKAEITVSTHIAWQGGLACLCPNLTLMK